MYLTKGRVQNNLNKNNTMKKIPLLITTYFIMVVQ